MSKHLVIQLARFGDLVQTKRLLLSLLHGGGRGEGATAGSHAATPAGPHAAPDAEIRTVPEAGAAAEVRRPPEVHLVVDASLAELARLVYPGVTVHAVCAHGGAPQKDVLAHNARAFAALAAERFDTVYNLNNSGLNTALAALFSPDTVRGYRIRDGQPLRDRWMRMAFRWVRHRRLSPLNLVDFWAALAPCPVDPARVNPIARRGGRGIGVVLAGRMSRRSLPPEVLAACLRAVFEGQDGARVTFFGTRAERPLLRKVLDQLPASVAGNHDNLVGRTGWTGLADALTGLDTLLTPDTGTQHLAAHLGVPVQGFFLSSAWCHETGPYGAGHRVWQATQDCLPCLEARPCSVEVQCLEAFRSREFLSLLSGRPLDRHPAGMLGMVSSLDAVGSTWRTVYGTDPSAPRRAELRTLAGEFLGLFAGRELADHDLVRLLYHEADWMLPAPEGAAFTVADHVADLPPRPA